MMSLLPVALLSASCAICAPVLSPELKLLSAHTGVTDPELRQVQRNNAIGKVLPTKAREDVAVVGIVRVRTPLDFVLSELQKIEIFKKGPGVLQIGKFQRPPVEQDIRPLTLSAKDSAALRDCNPKACDIKLSAGMMRQIRTEIGDGRPSSAQAVERAFEAALLQYLRKYQREGRDALITYEDKDSPVNLARASEGMLREFDWVGSLAPQPWRTLEQQEPFERDASANPGFYYWSNEKYALKPVASLTQAFFWEWPIGQKRAAMLASKQLYASHYFEASLGLTILLDDSSAQGPGVLIVYLNSSRVDAFKGWLGGVKRALVNSKLPGKLRKNLLETRRRLEQAYGDGRGR